MACNSSLDDVVKVIGNELIKIVCKLVHCVFNVANLRISAHSDQSFRFKPITDSAIIRSLLA